jgi:hypothetical protein
VPGKESQQERWKKGDAKMSEGDVPRRWKPVRRSSQCHQRVLDLESTLTSAGITPKKFNLEIPPWRFQPVVHSGDVPYIT